MASSFRIEHPGDEVDLTYTGTNLKVVHSNGSHTATLLDNNGNTTFPVSVTSPTFKGNLTGKASTAGVADSSKVCTGNSATATKLAKAVTFSITGAVTAPAVKFDGSANVVLTTTDASANLKLAGGTMQGNINMNNHAVTGLSKITFSNGAELWVA